MPSVIPKADQCDTRGGLVTSKVGPKGQVVIPKDLRDRLGIRPGASVTFTLNPDGDAVEVMPTWDDPIRDGPRMIQAMNRVDANATNAADELLAMRGEDESLWASQFERWNARRSSSTRTRSRPG